MAAYDYHSELLIVKYAKMTCWNFIRPWINSAQKSWRNWLLQKALTKTKIFCQFSPPELLCFAVSLVVVLCLVSRSYGATAKFLENIWYNYGRHCSRTFCRLLLLILRKNKVSNWSRSPTWLFPFNFCNSTLCMWSCTPRSRNGLSYPSNKITVSTKWILWNEETQLMSRTPCVKRFIQAWQYLQKPTSFQVDTFGESMGSMVIRTCAFEVTKQCMEKIFKIFATKSGWFSKISIVFLSNRVNVFIVLLGGWSLPKDPR